MKRILWVLIVSMLAVSCRKSQDGDHNAKPSNKPAATWVAQYRSPLAAGYAGTQLLGLFAYNEISVVSPDVVFVAADYPVSPSNERRYAVILRTTDGGKIWSELSPTRSGAKIRALDSIRFVSATLGWAVGTDESGKGVVIKTTDGGDTWSATTIGVNQIPTCSFFIDAEHGWIGGLTQVDDEPGGPSDLLATTDGGATWRPMKHLPTSILDIFFANAKSGWAVGYGGSIYATSDGGASWNAQSTGFDRPGSKGRSQFMLSAVHFAGPSRGWIGATSLEDRTGIVAATENGGASWSNLYTTNAERIRDVFFANENEGWTTVGDSHYVYHTIDGGKHWEAEEIQFEQYPPLRRMGGADPSHVWAVGGGAIFYRVTK